MNFKDRFAVIKVIAGYQKSWTSVSFARYGSLYFSKDLNDIPGGKPVYVDTQGNHINDTQFAVGPSTGRENLDDGRATVTFDRGPCKIASGT